MTEAKVTSNETTISFNSQKPGDHIGRVLRTIREAEGVSSKELARKMNCSAPNITSTEGRKYPTWPIIVRQCKAMGLNVELRIFKDEKK